MARNFYTNLVPTNADHIFFLLKHYLKLHGWVVTASSDGTTYNASGDQITVYASGAGGIGNNRAWFVIRDPGSKIWFSYQRGTQKYEFRVTVSVSAFSAGSPSATQIPAPATAAHESLRLGGGTAAAPTFTNHSTNDSDSHLHLMIDDAAPYGFWAFSHTWLSAASTGPRFAMFLDPMDDGPSNDNWKYVFQCAYGAGGDRMNYTVLTATETGSNAPVAYFLRGDGGSEAWAGVTYGSYKILTSQVVPEFLGRGQFAYDPGLPMPAGRRSGAAAPTGEKGTSTLFRWPVVARAHGEVFTGKTRAVMGSVIVEWDGVSEPGAPS